MQSIHYISPNLLCKRAARTEAIRCVDTMPNFVGATIAPSNGANRYIAVLTNLEKPTHVIREPGAGARKCLPTPRVHYANT